MAYTINKFNGTILTVVEDGKINNNTDIKLVGKNFAGYGEIQNENFVFLLENFANLTPPPRPIAGQLWFDSGESKLKFYDGTQFKTTGGAEVSSSAPAGLVEGDFWWDSQNEQLFAFNGSEFVLVGPQDAGEGVTQTQSRTVTGTDGIARPIIVSILNDEIVTVISNQEFQIESGVIPGFNIIKKGITLKDTLNESGGVTSGNFIYWGTASNAQKLGGFDASDFVRAGDADFNTLVEFSDIGFAVGDSNTLRVFIENSNQGVISNEVGNIIRLRTKNQQGNIIENLKIQPGEILPGDTTTGTQEVNIGNSSSPFESIFASNFFGTSEKAVGLVLESQTLLPSTSSTANTVAVRDSSGDLFANNFFGTSEKAVALVVEGQIRSPSISSTPSTVAVRDSAGSIFANNFFGISEKAVGLVLESQTLLPSTSSTANTVAVRDSSGNLFANNFFGIGENANIGSEEDPFKAIFANNFFGTSEKAVALVVNGEDRLPSTADTENTVAVRDSSGDLYANTFFGTSEKAVGLIVGSNTRLPSTSEDENTVAVRDSSGDLRANLFRGTSEKAVGLVFGSQTLLPSTLATENTVAVRDSSGNLFANNFFGIGETANIGSEEDPFEAIFANNFFGTSEKAVGLIVGTEIRLPTILPDPNTVAVRDSSGDLRANLFRGTALTAKYADLAEKYTSKFNDLPVGTLVSVCKHGDHEVCEAVAGDVVIGIVSHKPALIMNEDSEGQPIALAGRVPVRIVGAINKGDPVWLHSKGTASNTPNGVIVAVSLETSTDESEKLIECVLKI